MQLLLCIVEQDFCPYQNALLLQPMLKKNYWQAII